MRKLLIVVVILAVVLLAPLLAMRSESTLLYLCHWAVDSFTELRLDLRDPVLRPLQGVVSASEIHLYPKSGDGPPFLSVLGFSGRITAGDIYTGNLDDSDLRADQVTVYVSDRNKASDPKPMHWLRYLGWLPRTAEIARLHVVTAREKTLVFPLQGLSGKREGRRHYRIQAQAQYDGEPLYFTFDVAGLRRGHGVTGIELQSRISAPQSQSRVELDGTLEGDSEDFSYSFRLHGSYTELADFLRGFDVDRELRGALELTANLDGDTRGFSLTGADFRLENAPEYSLHATGQLDFAFSGESALKLQADGELASMALLLQWLKVDLSALGAARGSALVTGSLSAPLIEKFRLSSAAPSGLEVHVSGDFDPLSAAAASREIRIEAEGPSLATLREWTGPLPVEPGPFRASALLDTQQRPMQLRDLQIELGQPEDALLRISGTLGLLAQEGATGLAAIRDARLRLALEMPDSSALRAYTAAPFPGGFNISGWADLAGSGRKLSVVGGALEAKSPAARLTLAPTAGVVALENARPLSGFAARLAAETADLPAAGALFGAKLPELGALSARGDLRQHGNRFALEEVAAQLRGPAIQADGTGGVPDLSAPAVANFHAKLQFDDPQALAALTGFKLAPGSATLSGSTSARDIQLSASAGLGDTLLSARAGLGFDGSGLHSLAIEVESPKVYLHDIGLQADSYDKQLHAPAEKLDRRVLGKSLEKRLQQAPAYDTDIRLDFAGIEGKNTRIQNFQMHLTGEQQRYLLRQFSVAYDRSQAEVRGIIDLNSRPAFTSLSVEALELPLNTLSADLGIARPVSGFANLRGGLSAQGDTADALLDTLDGNFSLALENAEIAGAAYDVLATDLLAWFYSGALLEKSTHIDCTLAQFKLSKGVVDSDTLYIETSKMIATGTAHIDLGREQLDVEFTPRSKSRNLQVPSSVQIKGPFDKPRIITSPIAAAFDATFEFISLVPQMARRIFGVPQRSDQQRPCVTSTG